MRILTKNMGYIGVVEKPHVLGLFKNVQMQGAQKTEPRGIYGIYVERCGLQRNTTDERFSTAPHCRTLCKGCIDHLGGYHF
jgi:hypothetical protein